MVITIGRDETKSCGGTLMKCKWKTPGWSSKNKKSHNQNHYHHHHKFVGGNNKKKNAITSLQLPVRSYLLLILFPLLIQFNFLLSRMNTEHEIVDKSRSLEVPMTLPDDGASSSSEEKKKDDVSAVERRSNSNADNATATAATAATSTSTATATATTVLEGNFVKSDDNNILYCELKSRGFGVDLTGVASAYIKAQREKKKFVLVVPKEGWHYARGVCPKQDLSCYFEYPPKPIPDQQLKELEGYDANHKAALRAITVPLPEIQYEVEKRLPKPRPRLPCGVIHVRHSDTVLNFGWGNSSKTPILKYLSLGDHIAEFKKVSNGDVRDIILLTDDQLVIDDCLENYQDRDGLKFHYLPKKRWRGAEGGWENHFPSGDRRQEMIDILTEREMVSHCSIWVGTNSKYGYALSRSMKFLEEHVILRNENKQ